MIHERDVRAKIAAVLRNEISIEDFARWIMANSWNMHKDSSRAAVELVSNIHLLMAERQDNMYGSDEFRHELSLLLNNISESIVINEEAVSIPQVEIKLRSASPACWVRPAHPLSLRLA